MVWRDRRRRRGAAPIGRGWIVHARSTTIQARQESLEAGIAHVRDEVMPMLQGMDGCIGLSMLVDRESGRCIVTTAWRDEEAMRASESELRPARERAAEMLGGSPQVDEWEIAVLHRDHTSEPGACVRCTWVQMDPQQADRGIDVYKMSVLPAIQEFEGFCSASLLVDRRSGRAVGTVTFDSRDAMERGRERARQVRERGVGEMGGEVMEVAEFELMLAHLRVPEMA
jgi:heme-degrading monooxygenase HmoA